MGSPNPAPFIGPTAVTVIRTDAPNCNCPDRIRIVKVVSPLLATTDEFVVNPILTTAQGDIIKRFVSNDVM